MRIARSRIRRSAAMALALALSLLVGGGASQRASAAVRSSGERAVFVPITPCRLFDTRPGSDNVGGRSSALAAGETLALQARGPQGNCNVPVDAVGISMNVAIIGGTAASFLTVFPSDVALPLAANLNWVAGQPPTPNKVDVDLAADGRVSFYNFAGSVDIAADVVGYYADHDHDDRYYTKAESDNRYVVPADVAARDPLQVVVGADQFRPEVQPTTYTNNGNILTSNGTECFIAPAPLPHGSTFTSIRARITDNSAVNASIFVSRIVLTTFDLSFVAVLNTNGVGAQSRTFVAAPSTPAVTDLVAYRYSLKYCGVAAGQLREVVLTYTMPL